mmetsp:Transcript_30264/g.98421  ORF Transcript_30264/g.98421 Transcript_30264/m.98421 type:complete len:284 (+) Transcript_30264:127-978(+)
MGHQLRITGKGLHAGLVLHGPALVPRGVEAAAGGQRHLRCGVHRRFVQDYRDERSGGEDCGGCAQGGCDFAAVVVRGHGFGDCWGGRGGEGVEQIWDAADVAGDVGAAGVQRLVGPRLGPGFVHGREGPHHQTLAAVVSAAAVEGARRGCPQGGLEPAQQPHRERRRGLPVQGLGLLRAPALPEHPGRVCGDVRGVVSRRGGVCGGELQRDAALRQDGMDVHAGAAAHGLHPQSRVDGGRDAGGGGWGQRDGVLRGDHLAAARVAPHHSHARGEQPHTRAGRA